jgi:DNA invertase Pin-like site-specific DNA recombinase
VTGFATLSTARTISLKTRLMMRRVALGIDTGTPTGKLMINLLGSIAEFERDIMLERQREGIAKTKGEGKFKGRAPTARAKSGEIIALAKQGMSKEKIAKTVGVGVASVYRVLQPAQPAA